MSINAIVIEPDGDWFAGPIDPSLKGLQKLVGGYIEAVYGHGATIFVNEDGKPQQQPYNRLATRLWWELNPDMEGMDFLVGTAVVLGPVDPNGDETACTLDTYKVFAGLVAHGAATAAQ